MFSLALLEASRGRAKPQAAMLRTVSTAAATVPHSRTP